MGTTVHFALLFGIPYAILAMAGFLLWQKFRSLASLLVALGFFAALTGNVVLLAKSLEFNSVLTSQQPGATVAPHLTQLGTLLHRLTSLGIWIAAAGLLSLALQLLKPASPNNRWSGRDS